jgi:predicted nucleic acid-binding protein
VTEFVLDCSIAMAWCFEDEASPETDALLAETRDAGAIAPALWRWETANVLMLAARKGRIAPDAVAERLCLLGALPIETDFEGAGRAWNDTLKLAEAAELTIYDAAYLELALRRRAGLATKDNDLRAAAAQAGLRVRP